MFLNIFRPDLCEILLRTSFQVDKELQNLLLSICMLILWQFQLAMQDILETLVKSVYMTLYKKSLNVSKE